MSYEETPQNVLVHGRGNWTAVAQRDVHQHFYSRTQFSRADLVDVQPPAFASPPIATRLVSEVWESRLLVLGGQGFEEKAVFARHLAWCLRERLGEDGEIPVQQWYPSSEAQSLENAFDDHEPPTVFVFPGVLPHHLGYDLRQLYDNVRHRGHYAIVATDRTRAQWGLNGDAADLGTWHDLEVREVYQVEYLAGLLRDRLLGVCGRLPKGALLHRGLDKGLGIEAPLVGSLTLREAASRLETPSRVRAFVTVLKSEKGTVSEAWVLDKLELHSGHREAVHKWFRQLDPRDQLLTLGLAFFDGLFDDQAFAALEVLVNRCWRERDPSLAHFDYHDLERVRAYFRGAEGGISRIEWTPEHRREVFTVAWELHRRRLLSTVPMLVRMVKDSAHGPSLAADGLQTLSAVTSQQEAPSDVGETSSDKEGDSEGSRLSEQETRLSRWYAHGPGRDLFGSPIRAVQLRRAVAETIGQLGRFSVVAVERALLDLAEDGRRDVQIVAAVAMAGWRVAGPRDEGTGGLDGDGSRKSPGERLFQILAEWQNEAKWKEFSQRLWHRHRVADAFAHIRATVALTVGYAALYDPPNHPEEKLVKILERLLEDRHPTVRDRLRNQALPIVVAWHLKELEEKNLLREKILEENDLLFAVASGIAFAFSLRPREAKEILESWQREAGELPRSGDDKIGRRERLLATVALAYGRIRPSETPGTGEAAVGARQIFEKLQQILSDEPHPAVREAVLFAMTFQTEGLTAQALREVEPHLRRFLARVTLEERQRIVEWLTALYLGQRRKLGKEKKQGDGELTLAASNYRVWTRSKRPLTLIEKILYKWLRSDADPAAQQVAMQAFAAFLVTALEREERKMAERGDDVVASAGDEAGDVPEAAPGRTLELLHPTTLRERLALFLAAPLTARFRKIGKALIPEYFALRQNLNAADENAEETLKLLVERFESVEGLGKTARHLRRAVRFHAWGWRFLGMSAAVLVVAAILAGYLALSG